MLPAKNAAKRFLSNPKSCFGFAFDWLKTWHEIFMSMSTHSGAKPMKLLSVISNRWWYSKKPHYIVYLLKTETFRLCFVTLA